MSRPAFSEKEFEIIDARPVAADFIYRAFADENGQLPPEVTYNRPITEKENWRLFVKGETPWWIPVGGWGYCDMNIFRPRMNPDLYATQHFIDGEGPITFPSNEICSSWFNVTWVFVPVAKGATVKPGHPKFTDASEWEKYISMPDLDELDWDGCAKANKEYLNTPKLNQLGILSGFWERLMSLMDVDNAAIAMIDEEQQEGVKRLFSALADMYIEYIRRMKDRLDIDCVLIHDDWGHQLGPFFSKDTIREMIVPYLRRVVDYVHSRDMIFELHSCGKNETLVPLMIEAGVDLWCPQPINDIDALLEKYKDQPIAFGDTVFPLPRETDPSEYERLAEEMVKKYSGRRAFIAYRFPPEEFMKQLYKKSREYFCSICG